MSSCSGPTYCRILHGASICTGYLNFHRLFPNIARIRLRSFYSVYEGAATAVVPIRLPLLPTVMLLLLWKRFLLQRYPLLVSNMTQLTYLEENVVCLGLDTGFWDPWLWAQLIIHRSLQALLGRTSLVVLHSPTTWPEYSEPALNSLHLEGLWVADS